MVMMAPLSTFPTTCVGWNLLPENFNPRRLVHVDLRWSSLHYFWNQTELQQFLSLRRIDLSYAYSLKRAPDFNGMPNLEYLDLRSCTSLEEVHPSLKYCKKLIELNLCECESLERFPNVNVESLESLDLDVCYSLEKFTEILGIMKQGTARKIMTSCTGIRELPLSFFDLQPHLTELHLNDICSSHSLSLRVFGSWRKDILSWFNYQGMGTSVSVNLPKNWYVSDDFLGFAACYSGKPTDYITVHLIPLCDDGMSSMTQEFALSNNSIYSYDWNIFIFLLVPLGGLWDASNANGKTPNDYGCIKLDFIGETDGDFGEERKFGVRLLYKNEFELCIGIRKSRYETKATLAALSHKLGIIN